MKTSDNPYASPATPVEPEEDEARQAIRRRLAAPSLGLLLLGMFGFLGFLAIPVSVGILIGHWLYPLVFQDTEIVDHPWRTVAYGGMYALLLVVFWGARHMRRLRSYRWAMTAAILAMIPTPFWLFTLPLGLWALWVLRRPGVRDAFEH